VEVVREEKQDRQHKPGKREREDHRKTRHCCLE
jgi:hypothetical protein